MDPDSRRVAVSQRVRVYQKHRGWARAKSCGFCMKVSHVSEMGVQAPPWRMTSGEKGCLTWYCCTQCAKHLDTSQPFWRFRAPYVAAWDSHVADTSFKQRPACWGARPSNPSIKQVYREAQTLGPDPDVAAAIAKGESWADAGTEITFGSFGN